MRSLVADDGDREALLNPDLGALESLDDVLPVVREMEPTVFRVWLPPKVVKEVEQLLPRYNVTGVCLFPDFEGFTQSLNEVHRLY